MKIYSFFMIFLFFIHFGYGQNDSLNYSKAIKSEAELMCNYFIQRNYQAYIKFVHPNVVSINGGRQKLITLVENGIHEMENEGCSFVSIAIDNPSVVVFKENEIQSLVPQRIMMDVGEGVLMKNSYLIAISSNRGSSWYFVDCAGEDIVHLRSILPNLSHEIILPPEEKPILYND